MKMAVKLSGFRELDRTLHNIGQSVKDGQRAAVMKAAEIVADEARRLVPVLTGNLRDSIVVSERQLGGAFSMDRRVRGVSHSVYVGPRTGGPHDGFYGHMVEFGTVNAAAHPFMRPAFDNTRGEVLKLISEQFWDSIVKGAR